MFLKKKVTLGNTEADFFNSYLHIPGSEREVISFFIGRVPLRFIDDSELSILTSANSSDIVLEKGKGVYRWFIEKDTGLS